MTPLAKFAQGYFFENRKMFGDTGLNPVGWIFLANELENAGWISPRDSAGQVKQIAELTRQRDDARRIAIEAGAFL